jgi:CHASE3 domain sensor protein
MEKSKNSGIALNIMYILWGGASLTTLFVIMLVAFALNSIDSSHQNGLRADHTYQAIIGIHKIKHQMVGLEVDLRGFLITGQEDFLTHFQKHKVNMTTHNKLSPLYLSSEKFTTGSAQRVVLELTPDGNLIAAKLRLISSKDS